MYCGIPIHIKQRHTQTHTHTQRHTHSPSLTSTSTGSTIEGLVEWLVLIRTNAVWLLMCWPENIALAICLVSNGRISYTY